MFADGRTRITLLAVVFITSMMLTFSDSFFSAGENTHPQLSAGKSGRTNVTGHQQFPRWCDDNRCQRRYAG